MEDVSIPRFFWGYVYRDGVVLLFFCQPILGFDSLTIVAMLLQGNPHEEVFHFPLKKRLEALMSTEAYAYAIQYEHRRPTPVDDDVVADVFDSKLWKQSKIRGMPTIKLLFCTDGFPAFNYKGSVSVQPAMNINLSLPPWERYKENNILISMLLPSELSAAAQKKFFDKVVEVDYNPMLVDGIQGHLDEEIFRVEIFLQVEFSFALAPSVESLITHCLCHDMVVLGVGFERS